MANPDYIGLTENTFKNLVIDSGAVYKNWGEATGEVLLGCSRGGATFSIETELRKMPFDGAQGDIIGDKRILKSTVKLSVAIVEFSKDFLLTALPGSSAVDYPNAPETKTHDRIIRALKITLTDYLKNVAIVGRVSGTDKPIVCGIKNALSTGNFEIKSADGEEASVTIEFTGHFDPANLTEEPFWIDYPVISEV